VKPPVPRERDVQRTVVRFYRQIGATVFSTSQARRSRIALGLPDLFVCWPARAALWCFECKREGGKQSPDQVAFQKTWEASGGTYVLGGIREAVTHVERLRGIVRSSAA
jgi:hypothetical protein